MQSQVKQSHYVNIVCLLSWGVGVVSGTGTMLLLLWRHWLSVHKPRINSTEAAKAKSVARAVAQVQAETLLTSPRSAQRYLML